MARIAFQSAVPAQARSVSGLYFALGRIGRRWAASGSGAFLVSFPADPIILCLDLALAPPRVHSFITDASSPRIGYQPYPPPNAVPNSGVYTPGPPQQQHTSASAPPPGAYTPNGANAPASVVRPPAASQHLDLRSCVPAPAALFETTRAESI
ncbi:hypothetical protein B0H16DRAFT_1879856 [Mycena metata]|uniref:Uncharacterized protein n=1 Tax=Mycena metata TaxID=1033252 RepID=A0AAD7K2F0_9AGAR|nr:hypothetical protein B0H16DRAFT_1879856 [Mycena metata]